MKRTGFKRKTYAEALEKKKAVKKVVRKKTTKTGYVMKQSDIVKDLRAKMREIGCIESTIYKVPIKNIAWALFSMYIRVTGFKKYKGKCFTCGRTFSHWRESQACHYISRCKTSTLYDELNVEIGCKVCNNPAMGNGMSKTFSYLLNKEYGLGTSDMLYEKSLKYVKNDFYFHSNIAYIYYEKLLELDCA